MLRVLDHTAGMFSDPDPSGTISRQAIIFCIHENLAGNFLGARTSLHKIFISLFPFLKLKHSWTSQVSESSVRVSSESGSEIRGSIIRCQESTYFRGDFRRTFPLIHLAASIFHQLAIRAIRVRWNAPEFSVTLATTTDS